MRAALLLSMLGCTAEVLDLDPTAFDAGSIVDASVVDASVPASPGDYWTLEPKAAYVEIRGAFYAGAKSYVRVAMYPDHVCEHGGPVELRRAPNDTIEVHAFVWRHHLDQPGQGECLFINDQVVRDVPLPADLAPRAYQIVEPISGSTATLEVMGPFECKAPGLECNSDCDCLSGSECVASTSVFAWGRCELQACTLVDTGCCGTLHPYRDLECPPESYCETNENFATGWCTFHPSDPCSSDDQCPAGMRCLITNVPRGCDWKVELSASVRHPCATSSECTEGLVCVEREGTRRCEIPCFTNAMRCPFMHACSEDGWICEWLGE